MNLEQFSQLFTPLPGNHYLEVCTKEDEVTKFLSSIMNKVDGELSVILYDEDNLKFSEPFRARPREHDTVIFKDVFSKHENKKMILKLSYLTLANAANVIILEKKGNLDLEETKSLLQEMEFRSANEIDIIEGYDLVVAKKMHMWGNGL